MEMQRALAALTALSHATRLAVFRRLVRAGSAGCMPGDLAAELEVPAATLSFHLKELAHAGLIQSEPRGRFICYRANFGRMTALLAYLTENCCADGVAPGCAPANACAPARATARRR
jgi:ArsR family transcriptional regulator